MLAVRIPLSELEISFARSSGPGGQNVNKTSTKAILHWDYSNSKYLSERQKRVIQTHPIFRNRINSEGRVVLYSQIHRSQHLNKDDVIEMLNALVDRALKPKVKRIASKVSRGQKIKRKESKRMHSIRKAQRRIPSE